MSRISSSLIVVLVLCSQNRTSKNFYSHHSKEQLKNKNSTTMCSAMPQSTIFDSVEHILANLQSTEFDSLDNGKSRFSGLLGSRSWAYLPGCSISAFNSLQSFPSLTLTDAQISMAALGLPEYTPQKPIESDKKSWEDIFMRQLMQGPTTLPELHRSSDAVGTTETDNEDQTSTASTVAPKNSGKKKRNYKGRKIVPTNKTYVDGYKEADILCGRGGRTNHHPGNQVYLKLVEENKPTYRGTDGAGKRKVVLGMLETIREQGGRFLELDRETGRWYIVHEKTAYNKCGQALRDNNDEASRAAKRAKYAPSRK